MTTGRDIIQSLWVGERLSTMGRLAIQSFLANGHPFHLYCFDEVKDVPSGTVLRDASEILPREKVFAYKTGFGKGSYSGGSNFFRYKLLLDRGGWWVDTDVVCIQPFDFQSESMLASEAHADGTATAASNVLKQPAGSPLMRWAWRECRSKNTDEIKWSETGPWLLGEGLNALGLHDDMTPPEVFNPVRYYEWDALVDPARAPVFGTGVYAVHLWHQMWRENGVDPDGQFSPDCLYGRLRLQYLG